MDDQLLLSVLKQNKGFPVPGEWVEYARRHGFKRVESDLRLCCPSCGCDRASWRCLGRYVYFSTRIALQECLACRLIFADTLLRSSVTDSHFELTYKDESYFVAARRRIFDQVIGLVSSVTPFKGRVLDCGGAKGHLLHELGKARPDLELTNLDISSAACRYAKERFKLNTFHGKLTGLPGSARYDALLLIDSAYYEEDISLLWDTAKQILAPGGTLVLRVPNKLPLIRLSLLWRNTFPTRPPGVRVPLFNPEHLYIFSRAYLRRQLARIGLEGVRFVPAEPLERSAKGKVLRRLFFGASEMLSRATVGRAVATPSLLVVARKPGHSETRKTETGLSPLRGSSP